MYTSAPNDFTVTPAPLTITASSPSMTYGGSVPAITAGYSGFVNGDTAVVADDQAHLLDYGHQLEPGRSSEYPSSLRRRGGPQLLLQLLGGSVR